MRVFYILIVSLRLHLNVMMVDDPRCVDKHLHIVASLFWQFCKQSNKSYKNDTFKITT